MAQAQGWKVLLHKNSNSDRSKQTINFNACFTACKFPIQQLDSCIAAGNTSRRLSFSEFSTCLPNNACEKRTVYVHTFVAELTTCRKLARSYFLNELRLESPRIPRSKKDDAQFFWQYYFTFVYYSGTYDRRVSIWSALKCLSRVQCFKNSSTTPVCSSAEGNFSIKSKRSDVRPPLIRVAMP